MQYAVGNCYRVLELRTSITTGLEFTGRAML
jgi:hypothetical protein